MYTTFICTDIRGSHTTSENENVSKNEKLLRILRSQSGDVIHGSVVTTLWGRFWHGEWIFEKYLLNMLTIPALKSATTKNLREIREVKAQLRRGERREWKIEFLFLENEECRFFTSGGAEVAFSILREWISPSAQQPIAPRHVPILGE